ncbi:MAG: hypothetical protein AAGF23_25195, partial [Acidobacteriota bacterium]
DVEDDDVVFWGDLDTVGSADAYSIPATGGARLLLSGALPADANVFHAMIVTPTGGAPTAVFAAANPFATTLFTAPVAGGAVTTLPEPAPFRLPNFQAEPILYVQNAGRIVYATLEDRVFSQPLDGSPALEMGSNSNVELLQWAVTPNGARVLVLERSGLDTELYSTFISTGPPQKISSNDLRGRRIKRFVIAPSSDRVVYTANDRVAGAELFVSFTFGVGASRLSPVDYVGFDGIFANFFFTPDGSRVIYQGDVLANGRPEVFSVPIDGGESLRLNSDLPSGGTVVAIYPGSAADEVFFVADQETANLDELFAVDTLGAQAPERVSGPLMARLGEVEDFAVSADGARAVYLADQRIFDRPELFSAPADGGPSVRLSPDLEVGDRVVDFKIDPTSRRVVMRIDTLLWTTPVDAGTPVRLTPGRDFGLEFAFTPDGQDVVFVGRDANGRPSLFRVPATGGTAVDLLPSSVGYGSSADGFVITADGQRVIFAAPDLPFQTSQKRIYSAPIAGGEALRLSDLSLNRVLRFSVSADGSYVVFAARPAASNELALYGSPTDVPNTVELVPPASGFQASEFFPFYVDDDASHLGYILDGDLFSREIDTGVTRNLTEALVGTPQFAEFVNGGDGLLLFRGPSQIRSADVFRVDGTGVTPLTNVFVDALIIDHQVAGDELLTVLDPDAGNPLDGRIV